MRANFEVSRAGRVKLASFLAAGGLPCCSAPASIVVQQVHTMQDVAGIIRFTSSTGIGHAIRRAMETTATTSETLEPRIGRSVSLDHAAQLLGVSRRTIYNRIREGRLQTIRTLGGSQRVLLDSVQDVRGQ